MERRVQRSGSAVSRRVLHGLRAERRALDEAGAPQRRSAERRNGGKSAPQKQAVGLVPIREPVVTLIGSERDIVAVFKGGKAVSLRQMTDGGAALRTESEAGLGVVD